MSKIIPADWEQMIGDYTVRLAAIGQRTATIKLRRQCVAHMARGLGCPPDEVTADQLVDWFGHQSHWAIETRCSYHAAARGLFAWAHKTGRVAADVAGELATIHRPKTAARPASDHAWRAALLAADARVTLMIRLAGQAGLRRSEVAAVATGDLVESLSGAQLLVHGKGGKKRLVPISDSLAEVVRAGAAGHTFAAPAEGYLFPSRKGGHLTPAYLGELVSAVLPGGYSMHTLRHRFSSRAYRGTRNIRAVQVLLGHESVATTERYTAVDDDETRAAMTAAGGD
jgi:integrase